MKKTMGTRVVALLLVLSMMLTLQPVAYAAAETEVETLPTFAETFPETEPEQTAQTEETTLPEQTEETTVQTQPEATEPAETEPAETAAETQPTECTVPDSTEETLPPEEPALTQEQLEEKAALAELVQRLREQVPGEDYLEGEILVSAGTEEEAVAAAEAYGGTLARYGAELARILLTETTVLEAVTAAADCGNLLPAAYPNYIYRLNPVRVATHSVAAAGMGLPQQRDWNSWVQDYGLDDPLVQNPDGSDYQWMHDMVNTYAAWGISTGNENVRVAVLDTGVQENHPDLKGSVESYDIGCGTTDCAGHGTHVAGIITANMKNGIGGVGIAPDVTVLNIRVFANADEAYTAHIVWGIEEAVKQGAWIINMSLGGLMSSPLEEKAVADAVAAGVTVIAAAGNNGSNTVHYPAAYKDVIAVTAVDPSGGRAWFSNYGNWADLAAPGVDIQSTVPYSDYYSSDGTSMAAPVVSGLAALYMSVHGWTPPAEMEKVLKNSASKVSDSGLGKGIVDAAKLFGINKDVPEYEISGKDTFWNNYKGSELSCDSVLHLYCPSADEEGIVLYTTDGKNPTVRDGEIVSGTVVTGPIPLEQFAGKTVTVKAAYVSGMGIVNKVLTLRLKVAANKIVDEVVISGPDTIIAGKRGSYTAAVYPESAPQDVIWSIVDAPEDQKKAKISARGELSTVPGKEGIIYIQATSKADSDCTRRFPVSVVNNKPVSTIALSATKLTMAAGETSALAVTSLVDTAGKNVDLDLYDFQWTSSNAKVVQVDQNGNLTALTKGSASITCKVLDGSNKTARCQVTVNQNAEQIYIDGQVNVAPGSSVNYRATVHPTNTSNKRVNWSLAGAPAGITISATGSVRVDKNVKEGTRFTVVAKAADGSGAKGTYNVMVANRCTSVFIEYGGTLGEERVSRNQKKEMTGLQLYSVLRGDGLPVSGNVSDTSAVLEGYVTGTKYATVMWETSNKNVVDLDIVNGEVVVQAVAPGTAKITCTTTDAAKKKASITVKVINPVSTMHIRSNAGTVSRTGEYVLAYGKSANNTVSFGNTYGVPTNKKVSWEVAVGEYNSSGRLVKDWTSLAVYRGLVSISSSGRLSTKAGLSQLRNGGDLKITVTAKATDGTGASASVDYYAVPPTRILVSGASVWNMESDGYLWGFPVQSDQWLPGGDGANHSFTVTSSNPTLVCVESVECVDPDAGIYRIWLGSGRYDVTGSARITIRSGDGSKTLNQNVRVYKPTIIE